MINKVELIGNVGFINELKLLEKGKRVLRFTLATNNYWSEQPTWHNVAVWDKQAEILSKYIAKGMMLRIIGHIDYRQYEKDGIKYTATVITTEEFNFLSKKKEEAPVETPEQYVIIEPQQELELF